MNLVATVWVSQSNMRKRGVWASQFIFYLMTIGTAIGLGNFWRFPAVVSANGGGAFVIVYIIITFVVGLPLLISELLIGKLTGKSIISAFEHLEEAKVNKRNSMTWVAYLSVTATTLILSYYAVVSGWVLHYLFKYFFFIFNLTSAPNFETWNRLSQNGFLQILLTSVHLILIFYVVTKDVKEGIERVVGLSMPIFILLLLILVFKSLSLPSSEEAVRYLFYPDFSKITSETWLQAMAQVLFTLSIGFGTMVTFGSYMKDEAHIPTEGFRVTLLDLFFSIFAALIIFPIVFSSQISFTGPDLMFVTVPSLFSKEKWGAIFGFIFFLTLYLASLSASISLMEVGVSNIIDKWKFKRNKSAQIYVLIIMSLAILPALSTSVFHDVKVFGLNFLLLYDKIAVVILLPITAWGTSYFVLNRIKRDQVEREFLGNDTVHENRLLSDWYSILKYLVPLVFGFAFLLFVIRRVF